MRIGMVLDKDYQSDMRVRNEAEWLAKHGHEVFVLYSSDEINQSCENSVKLIRVNLKSLFRKKLRALTNTIFNIYPYLWTLYIFKFVKTNRIDVLHIHDLYMFKAGFIARKFLKIRLPIVGDLHENYVEALKGYKFSNSIPGKWLISLKKWTRDEIVWVENLDFAICVIEEAVDRYRKITKQRNFCIVPNYVRLEEFNITVVQQNKSQKNEKFTLLYSGAFDVHRGLETIIKSVEKVKEEINNLLLVLVGDGSNISDLKDLIHRLKLEKYIHFTGWQKPENLPGLIISADICIIPHIKSVHTDNTIPHKLFHYMALKKPVIATNCNPIQRIISDSKCGMIFKSQNDEELSRHIKYLHHNATVRVKMGEEGYHSVLNKYNWGNSGENLSKLYSDIADRFNKE